jgi:hypothetical protein
MQGSTRAVCEVSILGYVQASNEGHNFALHFSSFWGKQFLFRNMEGRWCATI